MTMQKTRDDAVGVTSSDTARLPALKLDRLPDSGRSLDSTDAWSIDPQQQQELEREAELGTLRSNLASMAENRSYLENSLRSLTMSLRDLEERLLAKASQTSALERDLHARAAQVAELTLALDAARVQWRDGQAEQAALLQQQQVLQATVATLQSELQQLRTTQAGERQEAVARQQELRAQNDTLLAGAHALRAELEEKLLAVRALNERIEQLGASERDHKARAEDFARRLAERDGLIQRLEQEAESSVAVLDKIQSDLARLDHDDAAQPREPQARLLVRTDGDTEIVQVLGRRTVIGRGMDCQLRIDAEFVSRRHALVTVTPDEAVIEDLNSTNGVFVNGRRIARCRLADGDTITIGKTVFRYALKPVAERGA